MHIRGTARSSHIKDRHLYPSLEITLSDRGEIVVNYNVTQLHPYGTYKISICLINQFKIIEYQDDIIICKPLDVQIKLNFYNSYF